MLTTRADVADLTTVVPEQLRGVGTSLKSLAYHLSLLVVGLVCIPVLKLWLPELGEAERTARDLQRKRWADEDI
jgi:hypothetical protein